MRYLELFWNKKAIITVLSLLLLIAMACGDADTPTPVVIEKEVIKEVVVEKEVIKEVVMEKEVIKEVVMVKEVVVIPVQGGTLSVVNGSEMRQLDVTREVSLSNLQNLGAAHVGLLKQDTANMTDIATEMDIVADTAKSWEFSEGGKVLTLKLKDGIKFHNGEAFTAEEVRYNLWRGRTRPNKIALTRMNCLQVFVENEEALDDTTIKLTLTFPTSIIISCLGNPWVSIQPKSILKAIDDGGDEEPMRTIVGAGPFKFAGYNKGVDLTWERYDGYHERGRPFLDEIKYFFVKDRGQRFAALLTGQADMGSVFPTFTKEELENLKSEKPDKFDFLNVHGSSVWVVMFNLQKSPWDDVRLRRAVNMAIDQNAMGLSLYGEGAWAPTTPFAGRGWEWIRTDAEWHELITAFPTAADIEEAKGLVSEVTGGERLPVIITYNTFYSKYAEVLVAQLKEIGIDVTLRGLDRTASVKAQTTGDFELTIQANSWPINDPFEPLTLLYLPGGGRNYGKWDNPQVVDLYEKQLREFDLAKRGDFMRQIGDIIVDEMPLAFIARQTFFYEVNSEVRGWTWAVASHNNNRMDHVWLERGRRMTK